MCLSTEFHKMNVSKPKDHHLFCDLTVHICCLNAFNEVRPGYINGVSAPKTAICTNNNGGKSHKYHVHHMRLRSYYFYVGFHIVAFHN